MTSHLPLGALDKITGSYIYPKLANKDNDYCCPSCKKGLVLCKGKIRIPYFRHKYDAINPCNHYNNPGESQIHKDAKEALKSAFENKIKIEIIRTCICCKKNESFEIPELDSTSKIVIEYSFDYKGLKKIADNAYLDNNEIVCIFEIFYKHKTKKEDRPEPWFEIEALDLINKLNDNTTDDNKLEIQCVRSEKCDECIIKEREKRNENRLKYYRYCNKNNKNIILVPYGYSGNIKQYSELVNNYITQYLSSYELKENKLLFNNKEYYEQYRKTLFNLCKYSGSSMITSGGWNKKTIDIKKINEILKKDNLKNPITLFKEIQDLFTNINCTKCNNEGYCTCDLNPTEIDLLNNNTCLICKGTKKYGFNYDCGYCN